MRFLKKLSRKLHLPYFREEIRFLIWRVKTIIILTDPPYKWSFDDAYDYSETFFDYFDMGYTPKEAVLEDSTYWE